MRTKLVIAILLLVIVPTAILSFMATRALRNWEVILEQRMQIDSEATVQSVASQINAELRHTMDQIVTAMAGVQARGGTERDIKATALRLAEASPLISEVYVFMNPWDFIYPEPKTDGPGISPDSSATRDLLLAALRRHVASADAPNAPLRFSVEERSYIFGLVSMKGLYGGYAVNTEVLQSKIETLTRDASGIFLVSASGGGLTIHPPDCKGPEDEIQVMDSLSPESDGNNGGLRVSGSGCIAESRLDKPFERIRICAFLTDRNQLHRAGALRARIYGWAILLLASGIVAGAAFILLATTNEIRNARARSNFVIGISHDLRTPLSSMTMLTESLYMDRIKDPGKRHEFLGTVLRECERLNQLIERVLFFVRYGQRSLVFHRDYVSAGKLLNEAVDAFIARAGEGNSEHGTRRSEEKASSVQCPVFSVQKKEGEGRQETGVRSQGAGTNIQHRTSNAQHPTPDTEDRGQKTECSRGSNIPALQQSGTPVLQRSTTPPLSPAYRTVGEKTRIRLAIEPGLPEVRIDRKAMMQVLLNLLDNAEKYGKEPTPRSESGDQAPDAQRPAHTVDIDIHAALVQTSHWHRQKQWLRIAVRDFGMGIESGVIKHIFNAFYRSPRAGQSNLSGVGVGLALCRHVVRAHGGHIEVKSKSGKGTTFSVYLPVGKG